jgi:hypothetical protein
MIMQSSNAQRLVCRAFLLAALLSLLLAHSRRVAAQYFPNTQPITYNPYGMGPYGNTVAGWGANARLNLGALPAAYSQQLPSAGYGYNFVQPLANTAFTGGYNQGWGNSNYYNYNNANNYSPYPYGYGR